MNWLKDKIAEKEMVQGLWLATGSSVVAEIAGRAGFDWVLIDLEHGLGGEIEALRMLQTLSATPVATVVRVPSFDNCLIKRVLDFGASAVMAPMINNATEAKNFVNALRYPPDGIRGMTSSSRASDYGYDFASYYSEANSKITGIVQIETAGAVENIEEIVAVPGVDVVFIGHSDLSLSLNCFGCFDAPVMRKAEERVLAACVRHGKIAGMQLKSSMNIDDFKDRAFSFFALGSDIGCLKNSFNSLIFP